MLIPVSVVVIESGVIVGSSNQHSILGITNTHRVVSLRISVGGVDSTQL
jgi:hypothetical protein